MTVTLYKDLILKTEASGAIIFRFVRTILLADMILAVLVQLICFFLDLRTWIAYGTVLVWAGVALIIFACITGIGGFAARTQDAAAFSRSGAGDMFEHLQRITEARSSNLGCSLHMIFAAIGLITIGYLAQIIPYLF